MTKNEAMKRINDRLGKPTLTDKNTHFASVASYGTDEGWWLKIPFLTFKQELHFILNNEKTKSFQHLKIGANQILSPGMRFRSTGGAADAFMSASAPKRLAGKAFAVMFGKFWGYPLHFGTSRDDALDIAQHLLRAWLPPRLPPGDGGTAVHQ